MTPKKNRKRAWIGAAVLAVAVALIALGAARTRKVYDSETVQSFGIQTYVRLSDKQLVVDSTFGGVALKDGQLYSTYDRAAGGGKRACPT